MKTIAIFIILMSCQSGIEYNTTTEVLPLKPKISNYNSILAQTETTRKELLRLYEQADYEEETIILDSASQYISEMMIENIFPHWYGTEWDFNGHTNTPGEGEIACGYFVSTTLKHFGWNLNRYTFAQQASYYEVESVCISHEPQTYSNIKPEQLKEKILVDFGAGLFVIGLDNHVGFLLIKGDEGYFIHSDYVSDEVKFELIEDSYAFQSSLYVVENITHNDEFIERWLRKQTLEVKTL